MSLLLRPNRSVLRRANPWAILVTAFWCACPWAFSQTTVSPTSPALESKSYPSRILGRDLRYEVLLPPGFDPAGTNRYPVLYWLPDLSPSPTSGLPSEAIVSAVQLRILPPLLVVVVRYGADHFYTDAASGLAPAASTLVHELVPTIDRVYRTVPDRRYRAVQGVGRGGFGAFHLALTHTNVFGSAASYSGTFHSAQDFASRPELRTSFQETFGANFERIATNHPAFLAQARRERLRDRTGLRLMVAKADAQLAENRALRETLRDAKWEYEWFEAREETRLTPVVPLPVVLEGLEFASSWMGRSRDPDRDGPWIRSATTLPPRLQHHACYSDLLERSVGYTLYLPPTNDSGTNAPLPVVYHLHGRDEDEVRHLETTGYLDSALRLGESPAFAWVWLYGGRTSWFMDSADGRVPAQSVLLDEVIPHIENRWNLGGSPQRRAIDGWGMGAYGAIRYAAQNPALFGAALVHNPILPDATSMPSRFPEAWVSVFNTDTRYLAGTEPFGLLSRHAAHLKSLVTFRIVAGQRSPSQPDARRLKDHLSSLGFTLEFEEVPAVAGTGPDLYRHTGLQDVRFLGRAVSRPEPKP